MARDGLTKREIGWLLAQEARGAAQALRRGIEVKVRESIPPPSEAAPDSIPPASSPFSMPMLDSLAALDDAIGLLSELQTKPRARRRGRIDVGVLLYELAPKATISLSADGGTEVFGEESDLRRMLQLLLVEAGYHGNATQEIQIRRAGNFVQVITDLGPDASPQEGLERKWLNRMAMRAGGRLEVTGGTQTLSLPADGVIQEAEIRALKNELAQAQELGEAYARELASVLTSAETHAEAADPDPSEAFEELRRLAPRLIESFGGIAKPDHPAILAMHAVTRFKDSAAAPRTFDAALLGELSRRASFRIDGGSEGAPVMGSFAVLEAITELFSLSLRELEVARDTVIRLSLEGGRWVMTAPLSETSMSRNLGAAYHALESLLVHLGGRVERRTVDRREAAGSAELRAELAEGHGLPVAASAS